MDVKRESFVERKAGQEERGGRIGEESMGYETRHFLYPERTMNLTGPGSKEQRDISCVLRKHILDAGGAIQFNSFVLDRSPIVSQSE